MVLHRTFNGSHKETKTPRVYRKSTNIIKIKLYTKLKGVLHSTCSRTTEPNQSILQVAMETRHTGIFFFFSSGLPPSGQRFYSIAVETDFDGCGT